MSDIRSSDWSIVADDNNQSPPNGWPENQLPSSVNNSAREMMAAIKRSWNDDHPVNITAGSSSAYTVITSASSTAYATGDAYVLRMNHESTGTSTLNVNGIGARIIKKFGDTDTASGDIKANQIVQVAYDPAGDVFQLLSPIGGDAIADLTATSSAATSDFIRADISGVEQKISFGNLFDTLSPNELPDVASTGDVLVYDGTDWVTESASGFFAYLGSAYSVGTSNATVPFDTEDFDVGSDYDTGTYQYVAPVTGIYTFSLVMRFDDNNVGSNQSFVAFIQVNGSGKASAIVENHSGTTGKIDDSLSCCVTLKLSASDTVSVAARFNGSSPKSVDISQLSTYFSGHLVQRTAS